MKRFVCLNEKHYLAAIQLRSLDRNNIHFKCTWSERLYYMLSFKRNRNRPREHITSQLGSAEVRVCAFVICTFTLPARAIKIATNALLVYCHIYYIECYLFLFYETILLLLLFRTFIYQNRLDKYSFLFMA